jgi:hypothetical protein
LILVNIDATYRHHISITIRLTFLEHIAAINALRSPNLMVTQLTRFRNLLQRSLLLMIFASCAEQILSARLASLRTMHDHLPLLPHHTPRVTLNARRAAYYHRHIVIDTIEDGRLFSIKYSMSFID